MVGKEDGTTRKGFTGRWRSCDHRARRGFRGKGHRRTALFALTLLGTWQQTPSDEAFVFHGPVLSTSHNLESEPPLHWKEAKQAASRLVRTRQEALREVAGGTANFSQVVSAVKDERHTFTFSGTDRKNRRRFYIAVVGLPHVFVTVSLYRALTDRAHDLQEIGDRIVWSVHPAG